MHPASQPHPAFPFCIYGTKVSLSLLPPPDLPLLGDQAVTQTLRIDAKANATGLVFSNGILAELTW